MINSLAALTPDQEVGVATSLAPFDEVYRRHAASVHRYCLSQVGDRDVAEDLTHETFVRAFTAYPRTRPDLTTALTWLLTIAHNLSTDHHRYRARWRRLLPRLEPAPPSAADVETVAQQRADLERVTGALATLRRRDRQLIGLRVAADLSYREIAEVLGISETVAKVATFRALTRLRARLGNAR